MIYGAGGMGGMTGWRLLQRTAAQQTAQLAKDPTVVREQAALTARMNAATTADDLVSDYKSLKVALTAFGLEGDLPNKAFIRKVLESDLDDPKSLANRLSDKRYRKLAETFGFNDAVRPSGKQIAATVNSLFLDRELERRVGEGNPDLRLAMNARRELTQLATRKASENTKWFEILGNAPLANVVKTALGLPDSLSRAPIDSQLEAMKGAASQRLGIAGPSGLKDPAVLSKLLDSFVAQASVKSTNATRYNGALAILMGG